MEKHLWQKLPAPARLFEWLAEEFKTGLTQLNPASDMQAYLILQGKALWQEAVDYAQHHSDFDDRSLYWTRLCMIQSLRNYLASHGRSSPLFRNRIQFLNLFELASRGLSETPTAHHGKLIVISGFDPFNLSATLEKSNTSGACILALHQQTLIAEGISAKVVGAIFPVRYKDFDQGIVESFFKPYLNAPKAPDMIITISQIQDDFKVERYAGRRRSSELFSDNAGHISGGSRLHPVEPAGLLPGPEFIETSLPASVMRSSLGRSEPLANELRFMQQDKTREPEWLYTTPAEGVNAVCGSGGGFLSNEIFYRASLLRLHSAHKDLPMGHFHIPALNDNNNSAQRNEIVNQVKSAIKATLPYL